MRYLITIFLFLSVSAQAQDSLTIEREKELVKEMKREDSAKAKIRRDAEDEERRNPTRKYDSAQRAEHERLFIRKKIRKR